MKGISLNSFIGKPVKTDSGRVIGVITHATASKTGISIQATISDHQLTKLVNLTRDMHIGGDLDA